MLSKLLALVSTSAGQIALLLLFAAISYVSVTSIAIEQQRKLGGGRQDQKNWLVMNLVVALIVSLFYLWGVIGVVRRA